MTAFQEMPARRDAAASGGEAESRPCAPGASLALEDPSALDERNRQLAHAGIARAEDLLVSRYRLSSRQEAFDLLRRTSQRFNIKLHILADVAVHAAAPSPNARSWLPGRPLGDAPALPALQGGVKQPAGHGAVLTAALHRALHITGAEMGNVQLVENGMLRMEKHTGLNRRFTDYFTFVEGSTTSCAQAAAEGRQVTVQDVAACATFDEGSRQTILQAGSRACHSVPLVSPSGAVLGMISSHHERPLGGLTGTQLNTLHDLGGQVARWLIWHRGTVARALNHLHAMATTRP
ncbi:GAF and ANTAR domain-containing protein [Streptomyces sp. AM6-12]|uniref:GAF and ANTAR domain-containing protein n=1 Tax=Streptomyces sp. AM6-12 TaxID=3345149 RepID=UPI0037B247DF